MGAAKRIIEELKTGVTPEELARKIPWKELSGDDGDDLLAVALRLGDNQQSYNLLVYLFHISFGKDLWFSTEVLSQAVQHPHMTLLDRQAILPTMRNRLDQIKDQIGTKTPPEEKLTKYWLMEASYYSVNGNLLSETGKRVEATHNYQIAQSIFEQLGLFQKAAEYKTLNRRLLSKDVNKSPLPKTSPIRLNMPPTQPISLGSSQDQPQPKPVEPVPAAPAEISVPPFIDELPKKDASSSTFPQAAITQYPGPYASQAGLEDIANRVTAPLISPDLQPAETTHLSAGTPVDTIQIGTAPNEMVEAASTSQRDTPPISETGQAVQIALQTPEADQPRETVTILPSESTVLITPAPQEITSLSMETAPVPLEVTSASPEAISAPVQPLTEAPAAEQSNPPGQSEEQTAPQVESPSVTGIYYPLPDVWLEEGRLHILGVDRFKGDEAADQSEQIRQQCDVLIGIQLQIKMYQTRRRMLDQEMKLMESKFSALRSKIERLENKAIQLESAEEIPSI